MKKYRLVEGKPAWWTVKSAECVGIALSLVAIGGLPLIIAIIVGGEV